MNPTASGATTTGPDGTFTLGPIQTAMDQPPGTTKTVIAQKGRFRRVVDVAIQNPCGPNSADAAQFQLPGRRDQYPDTIPNIAVATGDYDEMECVLKKIGIEDGQFD